MECLKQYKATKDQYNGLDSELSNIERELLVHSISFSERTIEVTVPTESMENLGCR